MNYYLTELQAIRRSLKSRLHQQVRQQNNIEGDGHPLKLEVDRTVGLLTTLVRQVEAELASVQQ